MTSAGDAEAANQGTVDTTSTHRLTGAAEWFWYAAAAVGYVNFGIWHKWLLNWVMGQAWLVAVVCLGPAVVAKIRRIAGRISR